MKDAGNFRATIGISSQKEVIDIDRKIAINQQLELATHKTTGEIRQKTSYGHDTYPSKV